MQKKSCILLLCLFVVILSVGIAFASTKWIVINYVTQLIEAEDGGVIKILGNAVKLVIPPDALEEDTEISAGLILEITRKKGRSRPRQRFIFVFEPSDTILNDSAELRIKKRFFRGKDVDDIEIYDEDGEAVESMFDEDANEFIFYIPHFSYYYYPRR